VVCKPVSGVGLVEVGVTCFSGNWCLKGGFEGLMLGS